MKKRILAVIASIMACALMSVVLVACGGGQASTPTDSVNKAMTALKARDFETLSKYYAGDVSAMQNPEKALEDADASAFGLDASAAGLTDEQKAEIEDLMKKVLDFDYSAANEAIDGDKATVDLTITTYDFGTMATDFFSDFMVQAVAAALSGQQYDEAAMTDQALKLLKEKADALTDKNKEFTVSVGLTKSEDGTWVVDDLTDNQEFYDAILGGAVSSITELTNSLNNAFGSGSAS